MGVLSDQEEEDGEGQEERRKRRREVFLCIKQDLLLEVDTQRGRERCRLELSSLARVEATEAAWTRGVRGGRRGWRKRSWGLKEQFTECCILKCRQINFVYCNIDFKRICQL